MTPLSVNEAVAAVGGDEPAGCAEGSVLELYVISGAGHTWPGSTFARASEPILGPATSEIDASDVIVEFFASHPLSP